MQVKPQVTLRYVPYNAALDLMHVLLTRPSAQSRAFETSLGGPFDVIISPVVEPVFLDVDVDFTGFDGVVFTSQNGVAAFERLGGPSELRAYCVGAKTAARAQEVGLNVLSADGDIEALNDLISKYAQRARLIHISGAHTAGEVIGNVVQVIAYDQPEIELNADARALLNKPIEVMVPLFSARSASILQRQLGTDVRAKLSAICFSTAVATALDRTLFKHVAICDAPTAASMRDKMSEIFPA